MTQVDEHFAKIATAYRDARTTDLEPILYIKELLGKARPLVAADVGCGAGRYDLLLQMRLGDEMFLHCIDANVEMLEELNDHLSAEGIPNFQTHRALADDLPLDNGSLGLHVHLQRMPSLRTEKLLRRGAPHPETGREVVRLHPNPHAERQVMLGCPFSGVHREGRSTL